MPKEPGITGNAFFNAKKEVEAVVLLRLHGLNATTRDYVINGYIKYLCTHYS